MGILSANTLFHFTRNKENLMSILNSCFYPRYCLEDFYFTPGKRTKWAIPLVCFCDIPLSQIRNHTLKYGEYAIGLTKEWAQMKGITPVLYTPKDSPLIKHSKESLYYLLNRGSARKKGELTSPDLMEIAKYLSYLAFYIKPYEGTVKINEKEQTVKFYDEREWRYTIPENIIINNDGRMWITKKKFEDKVFVDNKNRVNEKYGLTFEPKYINYINQANSLSEMR